jgi:hypothetical protein
VIMSLMSIHMTCIQIHVTVEYTLLFLFSIMANMMQPYLLCICQYIAKFLLLTCEDSEVNIRIFQFEMKSISRIINKLRKIGSVLDKDKLNPNMKCLMKRNWVK